MLAEEIWLVKAPSLAFPSPQGVELSPKVGRIVFGAFKNSGKNIKNA